MAQVIGGFGVSHSPSMGYEYDKGITGRFDPRWKVWFDGLQPVKRWLAEARPDQIVIVYNDHLPILHGLGQHAADTVTNKSCMLIGGSQYAYPSHIC